MAHALLLSPGHDVDTNRRTGSYGRLAAHRAVGPEERSPESRIRGTAYRPLPSQTFDVDIIGADHVADL